jgi:cytochrome subunit of sulfide dehydrogenase
MRAGIILFASLAAVAPATAQSLAPPGATACSGCHGPGGNSVVPPLQGQAPEAIEAAMEDFRTGRRPATVMDRIAKGFSEEEIRAIAAWLGRPERAR